MARLVLKRLSILRLLETSVIRPELRYQISRIGLQPTTNSSLLKVSCSPTDFTIRNYAKGKDKKKSDKGKGKGPKIEVNEQEIGEVIKVEKMKNEMEHAINRMKEDFVKNLSLRSNTGAVENLKINVEGKSYLLMEVAQIIRKNPKTILVNMASFPQLLPLVVKAISTSGMNLNPQQDGTAIYIPVPKVTREHRENLAKGAKSMFVKCKDNIRDVQNKFVKTIKQKEKDGLAEDIGYGISRQVIVIADQYISQAEKMLEHKQTELLEEAF